MGKSLLILALPLVLAACEIVPSGSGSGPEGGAENAHADLACAACHQGPQGERGRATVPEAACTNAGCHETGGPAEVQVATVRFPHRGHGEGGAIEPSCAGCHTHKTGDAPITASVSACALCHINEVASGEAQECRLCHVQPNHSELTSQGVAVSHSELPWVEIGCVRCHYDVTAAGTEVSGARCRQCHQDMDILNQRAVGRDLHPIHSGINCTACHRDDIHEVRAMSSVVDLVCSDCHTEAHGISVGTEDHGMSDVCAACHVGVHAAQQRLILGVRPNGSVMPSAKFLAGITCRSCHIPTADRSDPTQPIRGQATACAGCHPSQYSEVLDWWLEGLRLRLATTGEYVARAERQIDASQDSARALVDQANRMVSLVADAGGQHNLELSDRLMREAVDDVQQAYELAGQQAPQPPDLGRVPHTGLCSYCHYESTELWNLRDMPEDFHRQVLQSR